MKNITVPVELTAASFALLKAAAIQGGYPSVESLLRTLALDECRAFAEALADQDDPTLRELFTVTRKGGL